MHTGHQLCLLTGSSSPMFPASETDQGVSLCVLTPLISSLGQNLRTKMQGVCDAHTLKRAELTVQRTADIW